MTESQLEQLVSERDLEDHASAIHDAPGELVGAATMGQHFRVLVKESWPLKIGLALVVLFIVLAAFGPYIGNQIYDLTAATGTVDAPPSAAHFFGTDGSGLDVFSRVIASPRIDLTIALIAMLISLVVGSLLGLLTSFFTGGLGEVVMRVSDTIQAFPLLVLAIIFVVMAGRSYATIVFVIAALNIPLYVRLIRSEVLSLRARTFVEAARANGDSELSIALRHVLPNAMSPGLAQAPITFGQSILIIGGLSFIGAGVRPPTPEWGSMISAGSDGIIIGQWWISFFPGLAMSLCVFGFAIVGDRLRTVVMRHPS